MAIGGEMTSEQCLQVMQRLLDAADQAYGLARQLNQELWQMRRSEQGPRVTPLAYSMGICLGDAEIASNRLGGLRNELEELVGALRQEASAA